MDPVAIARALVDIDSTTGREAEAGRWLAAFLRDQGFTVTEQLVDDTRFNVFAIAPGPNGSGRDRPPSVVFSTHFDCVPPFFPSRIDGDRLYGRGSCDAKGILAAQTCAADTLRREGETRVGLLFLVGEERGSDGARAANLLNPANPENLENPANPANHFLIDGEPTDNRLGVATRGMLRLKLRAKGRAAHSSYPELGESAIDKLIEALIELRQIALPSDPILGRTHYSIGLISGGVAPNVISPSAEAEVMFRIVSDAPTVRRALEPLEARVTIEHVLEVPPVRLMTVPGFDAAVFPFTTDIPYLSRWGQPLLFGPGSVHAAHTAEEFVSIADLHAAVGHYVTLARELLSR
ncbi:MAG: peptidase dimerization protein [Acidobacteria bacterium]|nr:MAG: peptidase dimerization protein [Acidobacteriota bacterium]